MVTAPLIAALVGSGTAVVYVLAAAVAGLGLHHMNQVSERIARRAALGDEDPLSSRWVEATGVPAGESLLAFRIGYPEHDAVRSPRRALDDVRRPVRT